MPGPFGQQVAGGEGAGEPVPHLLVVVDLQRLVAGVEILLRLHHAQEVVDPRHGLDGPDRLADEIVGPFAAGAASRRIVLVAGDDDEGQIADAA